MTAVSGREEGPIAGDRALHGEGSGGSEGGARGARQARSFDELLGALFGGRGGGENGAAAAGRGSGKTLRTPVSTLAMGPGTRDFGGWHVVLSTSIVARAGAEGELAKLLEELAGFARGCEEVLGVAVNQDPQDRCRFSVMERFVSKEALGHYQKREEYQKFIRNVQPLLAESLGVYLCKEKDGRLSHAYYPFGPAGEGGRDDMVFTSRD